jgi:hypothetical protein
MGNKRLFQVPGGIFGEKVTPAGVAGEVLAAGSEVR